MSLYQIINTPKCGTYIAPTYDVGVSRSLLNDGDPLNDWLKKYNVCLDIVKQTRPHYKDVIDGGSNIGSWSIPLAAQHTDLIFHTFEVQRFLI